MKLELQNNDQKSYDPHFASINKKKNCWMSMNQFITTNKFELPK
jgi:hypothetical protein